MASPATSDEPRRKLVEETLEEMAWHTPPGLARFILRWASGRLSMVNLHVLMLLTEGGPVPMSTLAEALDVSGASTTGIVDRMEERGLVVRERDAADRRVINVALTETGRQLMAGMVAYRRERLRVLLGDLTDEELGCLLMGTRALRRARERLMAEPDPTAAHAHRAGHRPRRHGHPEAHA